MLLAPAALGAGAGTGLRRMACEGGMRAAEGGAMVSVRYPGGAKLKSAAAARRVRKRG